MLSPRGYFVRRYPFAWKARPPKPTHYAALPPGNELPSSRLARISSRILTFDFVFQSRCIFYIPFSKFFVCALYPS